MVEHTRCSRCRNPIRRRHVRVQDPSAADAWFHDDCWAAELAQRQRDYADRVRDQGETALLGPYVLRLGDSWLRARCEERAAAEERAVAVEEQPAAAEDQPDDAHQPDDAPLQDDAPLLDDAALPDDAPLPQPSVDPEEATAIAPPGSAA